MMSQVKNLENTQIFELADFAQFCAIAFIWSWGFWLGSSSIPPEIPVFRELLFYGASFGPSVAAIFVVFLSRGFSGLVTWLKSNLRVYTDWKWILIASFFPIVLVGVAALLYRGMGGALVPPPVQGHFLFVLLNIVLIFLVGGPIAEEFGWRGFGQKVLQSRFDVRLASIILGVIWAIWHLPLFFMKDSVQSEIPFAHFFLSALSLSVLSGWLLSRSGGASFRFCCFIRLSTQAQCLLHLCRVSSREICDSMESL